MRHRLLKHFPLYLCVVCLGCAAWRQWAVGDVRSRLLNATVPQSIVTTGPKPEYAW
jgi:hypothetical protein